MLRILSSKRYWSLIGKIADDQQTIKDQDDLISNQQKSIEYLNEKLNRRVEEVRVLRKFISEHNSFMDINFPNTEPDNQTSIYDIFNN